MLSSLVIAFLQGASVFQFHGCCHQLQEDLLKEVTIIFITFTIVWSQVKQWGENIVLPINRKLD